MIGPLIGAHDVCAAVEATLQTWMPSVAEEIRVAKGITLTVPTTYSMPDAAALTKGQADLPAYVVSSPGLTGTPTRDGDGKYRATWVIVVTAFARGESYEDTAKQVRNHAVAIRTCLLQHPKLGGLATDVVWVAEEYAALDSQAARTLGGGFVTVQVVVDDVLDTYASPLTPPPTAQTSPVRTVATASLTVRPKETP